MLLCWSWSIIISCEKPPLFAAAVTLTYFKKWTNALYNITAVIYFPYADSSLVWLPSAQLQPPVPRPSHIYVVIITKGDLDQIACLIYKGHSLLSGSKKLQETQTSSNAGPRFQIMSKQNQRENTKKKTARRKKWTVDFCGNRDIKRRA